MMSPVKLTPSQLAVLRLMSEPSHEARKYQFGDIWWTTADHKKHTVQILKLLELKYLVSEYDPMNRRTVARISASGRSALAELTA